MANTKVDNLILRLQKDIVILEKQSKKLNHNFDITSSFAQEIGNYQSAINYVNDEWKAKYETDSNALLRYYKKKQTTPLKK